MIELYEIQGLFPDILQEGFSASKASFNVSGNAMITNWSVASPFFSSDNFDETNGFYTVPVTGIYTTQSIISYTADSAITTQLGTGVNPAFVIRKSSPATADLVSGNFPIFDTGLVLLTLRTILRSSTVTLTGVLQLTKGDILGLYYDADGLSLSLTLQNIQWNAYRLQ